jgi:hypothetical protein
VFTDFHYRRLAKNGRTDGGLKQKGLCTSRGKILNEEPEKIPGGQIRINSEKSFLKRGGSFL